MQIITIRFPRLIFNAPQVFVLILETSGYVLNTMSTKRKIRKLKIWNFKELEFAERL